MERQCWCQPISQRRLKVSLMPLDTPKSHSSTEDEQRWRNASRVQPSLNNTPHGPQLENIDSPRVFDFDPNAIQVMDDMEFEHLPEAVNREILKNSQEIAFEDEEAVSRRVPIKLYEERSKTLRSSREIILEEEGEDISIQEPLKRNIIRLNARNTSKIYKEEKLPLMKVEENHEDVRNILQIPGRRCKIKNNKDHKMYLERELRIQDQRCHIVPVNRDQKTDFFLNEEQKLLRKLHRNRRDEPYVISNGRFFEESERNAIGQLTFPLNRDQENPKTDLFLNEKQKPAMDLSAHLIDDTLATNDRRLFRESKRNAINTKDYEICLEKRLGMHDLLLNKKQDSPDDEEVFEQPKGNAINNMKYIKMLEEGNRTLRESLTLNQRSNSNISERENGHRVERCDKIRIESEKKRPASRLAKIIIERKHHPADFRFLVSPFSDLSPESGFCEGNLSNLSPECGRKEPHLLPRNRFQDVDEVRRDSSSSENNLSQKNVFGDVGIPEERVQVPIAAISRHACDNIVDESRTSLRSNLSRKRFVDEDCISVKCVESRIIDISSDTSNNIENVGENRAPSDSNLSHKHFFDEDHSTLKCIEVPFNCTDNNIHDINDIKHRVSSDSDLSCKRFVDDDNDAEGRREDLDTRLSRNDQRFVVEDDGDVIKCANVSVSGERITRTDNGLQHVDEAVTKRSFPNVSRKLFNDFDDSDEQNCCLMLAKPNHEL